MSEISRQSLFGKLNQQGYLSLQLATELCKSLGNRYVEMAHWLQQTIKMQDSDVAIILNYFDVDMGLLNRDLIIALDSLPKGASSISDFSADVDDMVERAWVNASLVFNAGEIRSGHLIYGILKDRNLKQRLYSVSSEFRKVPINQLHDEFAKIVAASSEVDDAAIEDALTAGKDMQLQMSEGSALDKFTVDLTAEARAGKIDPIVGRDEEIRQLIDILMRRRQNNPILTGEAGVGKTAVVEGLAVRINEGSVPDLLGNSRLLRLDIGLLQAGASIKGEFENRLKQVIDEIQNATQPILVFIDEAHTLIGAGGAAGTGDAANLLKPALARGDLRTIAATTWSEYKQHIEKDPALTRRFQVVKVDEPKEDKAVRMLRSMVPMMESHHSVMILDSALVAAVNLSHRYIPDRQLPDKCVSLLDTAAARVAVSQQSLPAELEDVSQAISGLQTELSRIDRETKMGISHGEKPSALLRELDVLATEKIALEKQWQAEKDLVAQILVVRQDLYADNLSAEELSDKRAYLNHLGEQLNQVQAECKLVEASVDENTVAKVIQDWTGIPVGKMVDDEIENILSLTNKLAERVIGQDHALEMLSKRIQTSRAKLDNPNKPIGVFMLAGTSGVGKTETALSLASELYGGEHNLITINMSEFQEAHTVSSLKGAPPGYVGYGQGGVLTEAVRRKPYSVVLLDEFEKAHPDVHELFFQVFDKGVMDDGEGKEIDFKNTVILITTNCGTDEILTACHSALHSESHSKSHSEFYGEKDDRSQWPSVDALLTAIETPLQATFPAALLGRMIIIPYYPLSSPMIAQIAGLQLGRIQDRIRLHHEIELTISNDVIDFIVERCQQVASGARLIDTLLTNTVLPAISKRLLENIINQEVLSEIQLGVKDNHFSYEFLV